MTGDDVNGRRMFERGNASEVNTALAWLLRGYALDAIQGEGAIDAYDRAIAIRSDFTPSIYARAHHRDNTLLVDGDRTQLAPMLDDFDALVILRPQAAHAYYGRANGWLCAAAYAATQDELRQQAPGWLDNCRADLDRADALCRDGDVASLTRRGAYLRYIGDYAGSAAAFTRAIAIDRATAGNVHPGIVHHRVISLHAMGDLETALAEITPICNSVPSFFPLPLHRAILLAELGQLDEVRRVCKQVLERAPASAMERVTAILVTELLQEPAAAQAAVRQLQADPLLEPFMDGASGRLRRLPDYLAGRIDAAALLKSAGGHPGARCELAFYIALREFAEGDRSAGRAALETCLNTGVVIFVEYRFAEAFMARAKIDPNWPNWIPPER